MLRDKVNVAYYERFKNVSVADRPDWHDKNDRAVFLELKAGQITTSRAQTRCFAQLDLLLGGGIVMPPLVAAVRKLYSECKMPGSTQSVLAAWEEKNRNK